MPEAPTWAFIREAALAIRDAEAGVYGICLRGKPGWGENMAFLTALANSFGARWFDMDWRPEFDGEAWKAALTFYLDLMAAAGPPDAAERGFNENLALFQEGKCGIWVDATVAASAVTDPRRSKAAGKVGFALAPGTGLGKRSSWLWAWALAIPASSYATEAAKDFIAWATSKEYLALVAEREGWANAPPGARTSLYRNPEYAALPFAQLTLDSINAADPSAPTVDAAPYKGVQYLSIPEFRGIAADVGERFAAALLGRIDTEQALAEAQRLTEREMRRSGYLK